jgi:cobalt-zinc-cadmium efflux system membrane fusion protein
MKSLTSMLIGVAVGAGLMLVPFLASRAPAPKPVAHDHDAHAGHDHGEPSDEVDLTPGALRSAGVVVGKAGKRAFDDAIRATGVIATNAERLAHVTPTIRGRVETIGATLGQQVKKGDTLATLNSVDLGNAAAAYLKAKVAHAAAHANFEREERLKAKEATTEPDYLAAKAADQTAEAEFKATRETLLLYGLAAGQIDALSWEQGESLSRFPILAPFDGTIVEMHITMGEVLDTSERIFTIADLSTVWLILDVTPRDAVRIRAGQRVEARMEGLADAVAGTVKYCGDLVRQDTRTVQVWSTVENPLRRLKPGAFVTAMIGDEGRKVIVVPAEAVQTIGETAVVFVRADESKFRKTAVTLGRKRGEWQEILAGLKPDDEVAIAGTFVLKSEFLRNLMEHSH